jgi:hypothetical protein
MDSFYIETTLPPSVTIDEYRRSRPSKLRWHVTRPWRIRFA